jgi:hypothetical protein
MKCIFFRGLFESNTLYIFRISSLCKGSVMAAAADRRPLTSKARFRPQTDPYVTVVEKITLEMFFPVSFGFQYSSLIHHRHYITTFTDRIEKKNTLKEYEILTRNFKKSNLTDSEIKCIFESPKFRFFEVRFHTS